jgi:hypothetical protein
MHFDSALAQAISSKVPYALFRADMFDGCSEVHTDLGKTLERLHSVQNKLQPELAGRLEQRFPLHQLATRRVPCHYHARSNAESTFSAIKRKFGDSVKAKNDRAMKNEVLAKLVCHNLSCLIHAMEEFGIDASFRGRAV